MACQLHQGVGRLLCTGGKGRDRRQGQPRQDAPARRRQDRSRPTYGCPADDQPSERVGTGHGPGDTQLCDASLRASRRGPLRRQAGHDRGRGFLDQRKSELSFLLRSGRRGRARCQGRRQPGSRIRRTREARFDASSARFQRRAESALAIARSHFGRPREDFMDVRAAVAHQRRGAVGDRDGAARRAEGREKSWSRSRRPAFATPTSSRAPAATRKACSRRSWVTRARASSSMSARESRPSRRATTSFRSTRRNAGSASRACRARPISARRFGRRRARA